eukprot:Hpha_TRINITY_DN15954_c1_g12::TRINITY_DN15954_c1_g12_i1::g.75639::m.75639
MDPSAALELLYPQSKKDYEAYVNRVILLLKTHEDAEAERRKAFLQKQGQPAVKKESNEWYLAAFGELLARALEDSDPDEIKAFASRLGDIGNKKLEQQAKDQGRKKVVVAGRMALDGRAGVDEDYGEEEAGDAADAAADEAEMERAAERDAAAKAAAAKKAEEAKAFQAQLLAGRAPREVDHKQFAAMGMMSSIGKKKDDDGFGGFGGGKKGKKKK